MKKSLAVTKLYGRKRELKELREAADRASEGEAQLVFIKGAAGTGKSRLMEHAFQDYELFGVGRVSEGETLSVLWHCIGSICKRLVILKESASQIREVLEEDELQLLRAIIPHFAELEGSSSTIKAAPDPNPSSIMGNNTKKIEYTVRELLKGIASPERPVILALDDLQKMDVTSFEIFKSLFLDQRHVVFVGVYRDDELDERTFISSWIDQVTEDSTNTTIVTTGQLSLASVEMLLNDILRSTDAEIHELALLLHTRTQGNIFCILQLVDFWQAEGLLFYDFNTRQDWVWNMVELKSKTSPTANVVDVVLERISRLSPNVLDKLKVFACLGYRFDVSVIDLLSPQNENDISFHEALEIVLQHGFLERLDQRSVHFAHNKIYEAACQLLSNEDHHLDYNIAMDLWKDQSTSTVEEHLFLCADKFLSACELIEGREFRLQVAHVQLRAAKRAASFSAFIPAARYGRAAVELLDPETCWSSDTYYLTLEAYTILSEYCFYTGQLETHKIAVDKVLTNALSIHDQARAKLAHIQGLIAETKFDDVVSVSLEFLKQLGEDVPESPSARYGEGIMGNVKRKLSKLSKEEIIAMPQSRDFSKSTAIQVLADTVTSALQLGKHHLLTVLVARIIVVTLDYGIAPYSAIGFAMGAQLFVTLRMDIDLALLLSETALALSRSDCKCRAGAMLYSYNNFHWRQPLGKVTDGYLETYRIGMRTGDMHNAFQAIVAYSFSYFYSGLPLGPLLSDLTKFNKLMFEYGHKFFLLINVPVHQFVLNLTGMSSDILNLNDGVAASYREKVGWDSRAGEQVQWGYALQLAVYCECLELATEMYEALESIPPGATKSVVLYPTRIFFFAVIAVWNFKVNGKRKWKKAARKHTATIRTWVARNGAINLVHKLQILEAEEFSMNKNSKEQYLSAMYDKAINTAAKTGFLQDAALASHLASRSVRDGRLSRDYFRRCTDFYMRWGARGITSFLNHDASVDPPSPVFSKHTSSLLPTGFRAKGRFDKDVIEEHKAVRQSRTTD